MQYIVQCICNVGVYYSSIMTKGGWKQESLSQWLLQEHTYTLYTMIINISYKYCILR